MAYITPSEQHESLRAFRKRTYNTLHTMALANKGVPDMRIIQIHPESSWNRVWHNLHAVWTSEEIKAVWYMAIHDVIATNDRLAKIRLRASKSLHSIWTNGHPPTPPDGVYRGCRLMAVDTLSNYHHSANRSKKCPAGMDHPPVLPVLASTAPRGRLMDTLPHDRVPSPTAAVMAANYAEFLRLVRWKAYRKARWRDKVGGYLDVL
jgi:hypothetical protein